MAAAHKLIRLAGKAARRAERKHRPLLLLVEGCVRQGCPALLPSLFIHCHRLRSQRIPAISSAAGSSRAVVDMTRGTVTSSGTSSGTVSWRQPGQQQLLEQAISHHLLQLGQQGCLLVGGHAPLQPPQHLLR
jgi:hypothetical protein